MGNLTKNTITRGAVVALALSAGAATTANAAVTRVSGTTRYTTATEIFKTWPSTTTTAVLAAGMGHDVDALTVAPLAKKNNAPVILVDTKDTTATIVAQFAAFTKVYIANGTGVVSADVEAALKAAGKTVVRLGGLNRTETALNIAKEIGAANGIVVANGDDAHLVDTLSIASIAAAKGMPIFLTQGGSLSPAEATYAKGLGATNVYALGGATVVTDAAAAGLGTTVTRLAGTGRYETNAKIVNQFKGSLDLSNIYVASGEDANLIDALAGAPLAGLKNAPIVFAHDSVNADVNTFLNSVVNGTTNIKILGGTGAVTAAVESSLTAIQTAHSSMAVASVTVANAKTLVVKFTQPVLDTTVLNGTLVKNIAITPIATAAPVTQAAIGASLSTDGLTLTLTPQTTEFFNGNYALTVSTVVTDKSANAIAAYSSIFTAADTARPTIIGPTYVVNGKAHFTLSEPINIASGAALAALTSIVDADGNAVSSAGLVTLVDNSTFDLNIAAFTADKNYKVTFVGLADFAGNLLTPNPTTFTVKNSTVDSTVPTLVSAVATSLTSMKLTFSEPLTASAAGVIAQYSIDGAATVAIDTTAGNATLDSTGTIVTVTGVAGILVDGLHNVAISSFSDLSTNAGATTTRLVSFAADLTAPTYVSSQILTIDNEQYLVVKYSENVAPIVTATALSGTYVDATSVTMPFTAVVGSAANVSLYDPLVTGASDSIKIKVTSLPAGNYTATVNAALVSDVATPVNHAAAKTVNFTLGSFIDSAVPVVTSVTVQAAEDTVTVAFDRVVTAATALNIGNYTIEGVNAFKSAIFDGNAQTVKLTLNPNVIALTGNRVFSVNNVATAAGKVMGSYNVAKVFAENVKPTLVSAAFASPTTITATFSELVAVPTSAEFEYYIDGVKQAAVANTTVTTVAGGSKTVTITVSAITDLSKAYTIKYVGTDVVDLAGRIVAGDTANTGVASAAIVVTH